MLIEIYFFGLVNYQNLFLDIMRAKRLGSASASQVEVPDGSKYVQTEDEHTRGASCVQNYIVWKHQKTHESLNMNARKSGERTKVWT